MLDILDKHYNLEELRELCFSLEVDYDNLGGEGKRNKARELLLHIYRQDRLGNLLATVVNDRPRVNCPNETNLRKQASTWRTVTTRETRIRHALIGNVRDMWIDGFLEQSIYSDILLKLDLAYAPDALQRERPLVLKEKDHESPVDVSLFELFQEHGRRLLILGDPGSGKTFTMLQLAKELLMQAENDLIHPVPVIFTLSSWATERKPLREWLVTEMLTQYQLARKVTRSWLDKDEFLLLLDGLDEVSEVYRDDCLAAINEFMSNHQAEVVVCSRTADYARLKKRLNVTTAVQIQLLTDTEISQYLDQPGSELETIRTTLKNDKGLQDLTKSPLTLIVMTLAYRGLSVAELRPLDSKEARRKHLFEHYVQQMLERRRLSTDTSDNSEQAIGLLANLAREMMAHRQTIFYIEKLQSTWLGNGRWHYLNAVLNYLLNGLKGGMDLGLMGGVIGGIIVVIGALAFSELLEIIIGNTAGTIIAIMGSGIIYWISSAILYSILGATIGVVFALYRGIYFLMKREWKKSLLRVTIIGGLCGVILCRKVLMLIKPPFVEIFDYDTFLAIGFTWGVLMIVYGIAISHIVDSSEFISVVEEIRWNPASSSRILDRLKSNLLNSLNQNSLGENMYLILMTFVALGFFIWNWETIPVFAFIFTPFALAGYLWDGLKILEAPQRRYTNYGIYLSKKNALKMRIWLGLLIGLLIGAFGGISVLLVSPNLWVFSILLVWGLITGFLTGLIIGYFNFGGKSVIQHSILRYLLAQRYGLPSKDRDLVEFLDNMHEHILLRRVGGGWIFIHRYLLEYFAELATVHPSSNTQTEGK